MSHQKMIRKVETGWNLREIFFWVNSTMFPVFIEHFSKIQFIPDQKLRKPRNIVEPDALWNVKCQFLYFHMVEGETKQISAWFDLWLEFQATPLRGTRTKITKIMSIALFFNLLLQHRKSILLAAYCT